MTGKSASGDLAGAGRAPAMPELRRTPPALPRPPSSSVMDAQMAGVRRAASARSAASARLCV